MDLFPVFLDLKGRACAVIGGGEAAARKVAMLLAAGARPVVVASSPIPALADWIAAGRCEHRAEPFRPDHLAGVALVISASGDSAVDAAVAAAAQYRSIPVNVVDRPDLCSFTMPAIVDRSPVVVAISTGGTSPVLAQLIRARIEALLPAAYGRLARLAAALRGTVRDRLPDTAARRRFWRDALSGAVADLVFAGRHDAARRALLRALDDGDAGLPGPGIVHFIGTGAGDPELLTLKALRCLQDADAVVHDRAVDGWILDLARRDAERIVPPPSAPPGALLVRLARAGKRVVRLRIDAASAEPDEETAALAAGGVAFDIVPSAAAAAPARTPGLPIAA